MRENEVEVKANFEDTLKGLSPGDLVNRLVSNFESQNLTAMRLERLEEESAILRDALMPALAERDTVRLTARYYNDPPQHVTLYRTGDSLLVTILPAIRTDDFAWPEPEPEDEIEVEATDPPFAMPPLIQHVSDCDEVA